MKIVLDEKALMPERAHETDAGLDLKSPESFLLPAGGSYKVDTGVHIELPHGTVGMLKSKSGLNVKCGILSEGVIDEGYTGSIVAKLYNHSCNPCFINRGDKITQLVILPVIIPEIEVVEQLEVKGRGNNGFGSSGR